MPMHQGMLNDAINYVQKDAQCKCEESPLAAVKLQLEKIQAWTGLKNMTSAIPVQYSTNFIYVEKVPFLSLPNSTLKWF